jgi:hypothetical protein
MPKQFIPIWEYVKQYFSGLTAAQAMGRDLTQGILAPYASYGNVRSCERLDVRGIPPFAMKLCEGLMG